MLITINNRILVSTEAKLEFSEKLKYLQKVFKDSIKKISSKIEDIEDKYYEELGKDITDLTQEDFEYHSAEISKLEKSAIEFPQILMKSTIVGTHSIFESVLSSIRKEVELKSKAEIKMRQLRTVGNDIDNILNYFKLVHKLEFNSLQSELTVLKGYIKIRNCIVHQNGDLSQLDASNLGALKKAVKDLEGVKIQNDNLMLSEKFVLDYIRFSHKTGHRLFEIFCITE